MHAVLFATKRVYWGTVKFGKYVLKSLGLTPARFDLLWVLRECGRRCGTVEQSWLWKLLGVHPTVVSRMVTSLEKLGFVTRTRMRYGDKRQRVLRLTMEGHRRVKKVARYLMRTGVLARQIDKLFVPPLRKKFDRLLALHSILSQLDEWRRNLRDTSTFQYSWHKPHPDH